MRRTVPGLALVSAVFATSLGLAGCQTASAPSFVVFFPIASATLDAPARQVIAQAAAAARATPNAPVSVIGWTDSAGSANADAALSRARADRVASALIADGVARSRLVRRGNGQTGDDPGVASRRVEIDVGG